MLAAWSNLRPEDADLKAALAAREANARDSGPAGVVVAGNLLACALALPQALPVSWTPIVEFALFVFCLIAFPRGMFAFARA